MMVRIWRGRTRTSDADGYQDYLQRYEGYRKTPGFQGQLLMRRLVDDETEFVLVSLWDSMEAIARYAGADAEKANIHEEDRKFLTSADESATNYTLAFSELK